jgi:site-specific recombinase XerD
MPREKKYLPPRLRKELPRGIYFNPTTRKFRIRFFVKGQHKSKTYSSLEMAVKALAARQTDIARNELGFVTDKDCPSFRVFSNTYLEKHVKVHSNYDNWKRTDSYRFEKLQSLFGEHKLTAITPSVADEYMRDEKDKGRSVEGIKRDIRLLKAILNRAVRNGVITTNPITSVKSAARLEERRPRILSFDEEEKLFQQLVGAREKLKPLVTVGLNTGLRRSELFDLEWRDLDLNGRVITVRAEVAKSKKYRTIPINEACYEVVKALRKVASQQHPKPTKVFHNIGKLEGVDDLLHRALTDAEITGDGLGWHLFRHTLASRLIRSGADVRVVQGIMGHSDIKTTMVYLHADEDAKRDAVNRLTAKKPPTVSPAAREAVENVNRLRVEILEEWMGSEKIQNTSSPTIDKAIENLKRLGRKGLEEWMEREGIKVE